MIRRFFPSPIRGSPDFRDGNYLAIKEAHREGFDGVVIVVDRDTKRVGGDRLPKLREVRRAAAELIATGVDTSSLAGDHYADA